MKEQTFRARQFANLVLQCISAGDEDKAEAMLQSFASVSLFDGGQTVKEQLDALSSEGTTLLMAHSPGVFAKDGKITVTSGLFHDIFQNGRMERRLGRMDAVFEETAQDLRCISFTCYDLLSFAQVPAVCAMEKEQIQGEIAAEENTVFFNLAASTAMHLNACNMHEQVQLLWEGIQISGKEAADRFLRENGTAALLLTTPVQQKDACTWLAVRFARDGDSVQEQFGNVRCSFEKADGTWKISRFSWTKTAAAASTAYRPTQEKTAFPVVLPGRPLQVCTEDAAAIQTLMLRWVYALQTGSLRDFYRQHMVHNNPYIALHGMAAEGCSAVEADVSRMDHGYLDLPMRSPICHTCTTPFLSIDGDYAEGFWIDYNFTNLAQVAGVREPQPEVRYSTGICVYHHTFRRENGRWKMEHFTWRSVFSMTELLHRPGESAGWVGGTDKREWPPLEK